MIPAWVVQYQTIPYRDRGRTHDGVDCYGLVYLVYRERLNIMLPSYTEDYATANDTKEICALLRGAVGNSWHEISREAAQPYDGVIFRISGQPTHFGLVLDPPWFLHALKERGPVNIGKVAIERWDTMLWARRLLGVVRWQST